MHHKQRTVIPQSTLGGYIWEASVGKELPCRCGKGEVQALVHVGENLQDYEGFI